MNTTLVFAELLITGLHTVIWMLLLALNVFGTRWLQEFLSTSSMEWKSVLLVVLLGAAYILGIIVDRVADTIFTRWDNKARIKILPDTTLKVVSMRFELIKDNQALSHQFEYTRSRLRVVRASALNFAITTLLLSSLILLRVPSSPETLGYIVFTVVVGLLLTVGSIFAWYILTQSYFILVKKNWEFQVSQKNKMRRSIGNGKELSESRKAG